MPVSHPNRVDAAFARLRKDGRKAFVAYITAGDPSLRATEKLAFEMERAGVDVLELGVPFSDPLADGVVNQLAAERALRAGTTLRGLLRSVRALRRRGLRLPLVFFTYFNPIHRYGPARFVREAAAAGVDGALVLDLPVEESAEWRTLMERAGLRDEFATAFDIAVHRSELCERGEDEALGLAIAEPCRGDLFTAVNRLLDRGWAVQRRGRIGGHGACLLTGVSREAGVLDCVCGGSGRFTVPTCGRVEVADEAPHPRERSVAALRLEHRPSVFHLLADLVAPALRFSRVPGHEQADAVAHLVLLHARHLLGVRVLDQHRVEPLDAVPSRGELPEVLRIGVVPMPGGNRQEHVEDGARGVADLELAALKPELSLKVARDLVCSRERAL
ncbi:MAG: tryptophan synthase subunit alpha, partial [Verrucomicrobiae bacterium]|nr:tryptophan synthase subunit alpha [Verrucomicrobiae bacterium]